MANNRRLAQVGSFVGSTSSDKISFQTNTGIGTTNPTSRLTVDGDTLITGVITATSFFGSVTGDITGNADTATALQTARDFSVSGDVTTSSAVSFDGTENVGLAVSLTETGVVSGTYGASNLIPRITVDVKGRITHLAQNSFEIIQDTSPQLGGNLDLNGKNVTGTSTFNVSGVISATTFNGSGASLTNIPNGALDNSSVSYGGVSLSLGGSDASPAFDLSDATNYPYTSLTGVTTSIVGDTSPQLGGDLDLNSKNVTGTGNISITGGVSASGIVTATGGFNLGISSAGTSITSGSPVTTLNFVGTGNTFAFNGTTVDISIAGGGVSEVETTVSTTNATGVGSFAVATYRSADVIAQISQGSNYQVGRYLMIHDGTTVTVVEESSIATGSMLGSFNGVINGANAELRVTLVSAGTAATVTTKIDTVTIP